MKLCPACNKPAKKSFAYKNLYVCNCLGMLEDISIILKKVDSTQPVSLLFGHINFVPQNKEILGSILGANGNIYYFDLEKYSFSLGSFVRFKSVTHLCEGSSLEIICAQDLELVTAID